MQFNKGSEVEKTGALTYPFKVHQPAAAASPTVAAAAERVFQQSVTLHAYMDGYPRATDETVSNTGWFIWGITEAQLPILVGAAAGGLVLLLTLLGLLLWRCFQHQKDKEKQYCLEESEEERECRRRHINAHKRSSHDSVVFIGTLKTLHSRQPSQSSGTGVEASAGNSAAGISRSVSAPLKERDVSNMSVRSVTPKKRPQSQLLRYNSTDITFAPHLYYNQCAEQVSHQRHNLDAQLPDIPEVRLHSTETLDSDSQVSSYCDYDTPVLQYQLPMGPSNSTSLKTRSLPTWVRSRPRPLSTEDDLNELYAKVNFNKKRKNRMRNDSAAAIALNKSRSQFIHFSFMHKDTDSLVDNEAVVVYDERTAL